MKNSAVPGEYHAHMACFLHLKGSWKRNKEKKQCGHKLTLLFAFYTRSSADAAIQFF